MKRLLVLVSILALTACYEREYTQWDKNKEPERKTIIVEHVVTQDGLECIIRRGPDNSAMSCNWPDWNFKRNNGKLVQPIVPGPTGNESR